MQLSKHFKTILWYIILWLWNYSHFCCSEPLSLPKDKKLGYSPHEATKETWYSVKRLNKDKPLCFSDQHSQTYCIHMIPLDAQSSACLGLIQEEGTKLQIQASILDGYRTKTGGVLCILTANVSSVLFLFPFQVLNILLKLRKKVNNMLQNQT